MRLGLVLLLFLSGASSAFALDLANYEGFTPAEIFCTEIERNREPAISNISALFTILEGPAGCQVPSERPPDFRNFAQGPTRKKAFINFWGPHAVMIQEKTGLPASVLIAQWAEESFWGASNLYVNSHNMSGHFCPARKEGQIYQYEITVGDYKRTMVARCEGNTSQRGSRALVFTSPVDSAWAHAYNLIQSPSRVSNYRKIREEAAKGLAGQGADWKKIIPELNRHYAPNQGYGRKLTNHVTSNGLTAWEKKPPCP